MRLIGFLILFIVGMLIGLLPEFEDKPKPKSNTVIKYCNIDSVSIRFKNQMIPVLEYKYYTPCGVFSFNDKKFVVGDSIEIQINIIKNE